MFRAYFIIFIFILFISCKKKDIQNESHCYVYFDSINFYNNRIIQREHFWESDSILHIKQFLLNPDSKKINESNETYYLSQDRILYKSIKTNGILFSKPYLSYNQNECILFDPDESFPYLKSNSCFLGDTIIKINQKNILLKKFLVENPVSDGVSYSLLIDSLFVMYEKTYINGFSNYFKIIKVDADNCNELNSFKLKQ